MKRPPVALLVVLALTFGIGVAVREAPWEDEYYTLRALGDREALWGYRFMPASFVYQKVGHLFGDGVVWMRLWSLLPYVAATVVAHRLLLKLGAERRDALGTVALLCLNPFLLHEGASVRYYGFYFFAAIVALYALVSLVDGSVRGGARWGAVGLLFLPQLTTYSGATLLVVAAGYGGWHLRRMRSRRARVAVAAAVVVSVGLIVVALAPEVARLRDPQTGRISLPIDLGFPRPPADVWALAYQYNKLLGWNYLSWHAPGRWVEGASLGVVAAGLVAFARRAREVRHRWLIVILASVPTALWAISPLVNVIGPRYYAYAAFPVAFVVVRGLGWTVPFAVTALALVVSVGVPTNPPLRELDRTLRLHEVRLLGTTPGWYRQCLGYYFEDRGTQVLPVTWRGEQTEGDPRWLFRKYPRYLSAERGRAPLPPEFRVAERYVSLKKYYFHDVRVTDELLVRDPR